MTDELPGTPRYFLSYTGVKLPLTLLNELQASQLENRIAYFIGYYDEQDRLAGLRKMVYGEIEMAHRYHYDGNGVLRKVEISDIDGEVTVMEFDENGNAVNP